MNEFYGAFPVVFSPEGELKWAFTENGTLLEINYINGVIKPLINEVCPHTQFVYTQFPSPVMEMVGQYKDWIHYDLLEHMLVRRCKMEDLDNKAEIAACVRYGERLLIIATYADQRETELLEYVLSHTKELLNLKFKYKLGCAISLSQHLRLIACIYGENGRNIALFDLNQNRLENIFKGHDIWVQALCFIDNADLLVSGDQYGILKFWRVSSGEMIKSLALDCNSINAITFSNKYYALFVLGTRPSGKTEQILDYNVPINESLFYVWNMVSQGDTKIITIGAEEDYAKALAISPDEEILVTGRIFQHYMSENQRQTKLKCWNIRELVP